MQCNAMHRTVDGATPSVDNSGAAVCSLDDEDENASALTAAAEDGADADGGGEAEVAA